MTTLTKILNPCLPTDKPGKRPFDLIVESGKENPAGTSHLTKRLREPQGEVSATPTTDRLWRAMQSLYKLPLSRTQFTGLCAYLCAILQAGFSLDERHMDAFFVSYPTFEAQLARYRRPPATKGTNAILLAHHQWFSQQVEHHKLPSDIGGTEADKVLDGQRLRAIGRENSQLFCDTAQRLKAIADKARNVRGPD